VAGIVDDQTEGRPVRISRRGGNGTGACQAGCKSAGFSVPLPAAVTGTTRGTLAVVTSGADAVVGVDWSLSLAVMNWKSVRAPASALWPSAVTTRPPTLQASGCRSQKPRASETAALARVTACVASICASGCEPLPGNSTQTTPNQNAIRNKKNMTLPATVPGGFSPPLSLNVADEPEAVVGDVASIWTKIDANTDRTFIEFETSEFD
jgi:hypothetical protein